MSCTERSLVRLVVRWSMRHGDATQDGDPLSAGVHLRFALLEREYLELLFVLFRLVWAGTKDGVNCSLLVKTHIRPENSNTRPSKHRDAKLNNVRTACLKTFLEMMT